jgi:hypothetical protein
MCSSHTTGTTAWVSGSTVLGSNALHRFATWTHSGSTAGGTARGTVTTSVSPGLLAAPWWYQRGSVVTCVTEPKRYQGRTTAHGTVKVP